MTNKPQENSTPAQSGQFTRRQVLQTSAAGAAAVGIGTVAANSTASAAPLGSAKQPNPPINKKMGKEAFQHGVASGDPYPDSVLLWTRVTSNENDYPGDGKGQTTNVKWEVASDEKFTQIVTSGTAKAEPAGDMTVKVEARGLKPYTGYFYRFTTVDGPRKGQTSPVGKTRTAPAKGADVSELRFALFSCSNWEAGFFSAYRDMANRGDIDYALHVGDYIYEYPRGEYTGKTGSVRLHEPANEIVSLADYRQRYAQHHTDPDLQAAHAACPWIVTWDDHEVANDNWSNGAENHQADKEGDFIARRNAAMQAYLEWLPIRATPLSEKGHIYRNLSFGNLVELNMLDLRTYRNEKPGFTAARKTDDESRTMLGSEQFGWLTKKLSTSTARWNFIGNSVMFSPVLIPPLDPEATKAVTQLLGLPEEGMPYNFDQWDGYAAERRRVIKYLVDNKIRNTVWLTGDIHSSWANDIPAKPGTYPNGGTAGVEIVCTSVTSSNIDDILKLPEDNALSHTVEYAFTNMNRHVKYLDFDSHGYTVVRVTKDAVDANWIFLAPDGKLKPNQPLHFGKAATTKWGEGIHTSNVRIDPAKHSAH